MALACRRLLSRKGIKKEKLIVKKILQLIDLSVSLINTHPRLEFGLDNKASLLIAATTVQIIVCFQTKTSHQWEEKLILTSEINLEAYLKRGKILRAHLSLSNQSLL